MQRHSFIALVLVALSLPGSPVLAQGVQAGTVTGTVASTDGVPLPGVTVTATSAALQGERTTVTDVNGVYALRALPAGAYRVSFGMQDFQPSTRDDVIVTLGGIAAINATMSLAARAETVTVTAEAPSSIAALATSQTFEKREIDALPVGRRPVDIAELAPGLTTNTFAAGQVIIGGRSASTMCSWSTAWT